MKSREAFHKSATVESDQRSGSLKKWRPIRFAGAGMLAIGYIALAGAVYFLVVNSLFWLRASSTTGEVVGLERMESESERLKLYTSHQAKAQATIVSFRTEAGQDIVFTTDWGSSSNPYSRGDTVRVLYDVQNPGNAKIRSFPSLFLGPLLLLIMGAGLWFFGTLTQALTSSKPKPRERHSRR